MRKKLPMSKEKLRDLLKAWTTIAQDHFKRLQESMATWKQNIKNEEWLKIFAHDCNLQDQPSVRIHGNEKIIALKSNNSGTVFLC